VCVCVFAQYDEKSLVSNWFIFRHGGLKAYLVSEDVSLSGLNYSYNSPTTTDSSGNFYYCISEGNPQGALWRIMKIDRLSREVEEICRLNLDRYKQGAIKAIEFTTDDILYVWLTLRASGIGSKWSSALVAITGF
jgi:hypothetical protein